MFWTTLILGLLVLGIRTALFRFEQKAAKWLKEMNAAETANSASETTRSEEQTAGTAGAAPATGEEEDQNSRRR